MNTKIKSTLGVKIFCLFVGFTLLFPFSLGAISNFKGQLVYLKECRVCHLGSKTFLSSHEIEYLEKVFDSNGRKLSDIHLKKEEVFKESKEGIRKSSHKYFKSDAYKNGYKALKAFILESSSKSSY